MKAVAGHFGGRGWEWHTNHLFRPSSGAVRLWDVSWCSGAQMVAVPLESGLWWAGRTLSWGDWGWGWGVEIKMEISRLHITFYQEPLPAGEPSLVGSLILCQPGKRIPSPSPTACHSQAASLKCV